MVSGASALEVARGEMDLARPVIAAVQARFPGALVWFGAHTERWWAVLGGCLVEAESPAELGRALGGLAVPEARPDCPCGCDRRHERRGFGTGWRGSRDGG